MNCKLVYATLAVLTLLTGGVFAWHDYASAKSVSADNSACVAANNEICAPAAYVRAYQYQSDLKTKFDALQKKVTAMSGPDSKATMKDINAAQWDLNRVAWELTGLSVAIQQASPTVAPCLHGCTYNANTRKFVANAVPAPSQTVVPIAPAPDKK